MNKSWALLLAKLTIPLVQDETSRRFLCRARNASSPASAGNQVLLAGLARPVAGRLGAP